MFHILDGGCRRLLWSIYHNDGGSNETGKAPYLADEWQPLFQEYGRENCGNNHRLEKLDVILTNENVVLDLPRRPKVWRELPVEIVSIAKMLMSSCPYLNKSIRRKITQFTQYHCSKLDCILKVLLSARHILSIIPVHHQAFLRYPTPSPGFELSFSFAWSKPFFFRTNDTPIKHPEAIARATPTALYLLHLFLHQYIRNSNYNTARMRYV